MSREAAVEAKLREALEAIRDMEPEPVDDSLPDHSECAECKRESIETYGVPLEAVA